MYVITDLRNQNPLLLICCKIQPKPTPGPIPDGYGFSVYQYHNQTIEGLVLPKLHCTARLVISPINRER